MEYLWLFITRISPWLTPVGGYCIDLKATQLVNGRPETRAKHPISRSIALGTHITFHPTELKLFLFRWVKKHKRAFAEELLTEELLLHRKFSLMFEKLYAAVLVLHNLDQTGQFLSREHAGRTEEKNRHHDVLPVLEGPLECNFLELVN